MSLHRPSFPVSLVAAALLGAAGCRLDPALVHPDTDTKPAWRDRAPEVASLANIAWFDLYGDEALRGLVHAAIEANPDLAIALARIDEARAIATATGADLYPRVDLAAKGAHLRAPRSAVPSGSRESWDVAVSFDVTWELDLFGRVRSEAAAAQARYFASVEAERDVGIRLVSEVARAYFEMRALDEIAAVAERTLKSREEYVGLAKTRFEGGKTSEIDFRQAESEYYRTESIYVDVQRQIAGKENQLAVLLGRSPGAVPRGRAAAEQPLPAAVPAGLPSDLLRRRPDVAAAEQVLVSETALVGAARANLYPRIALTGSFGWESDELANLFTNPSITSSLIAGLLQPVFNAGRNRALVEAQCARMRAAMEGYRKVVLAAFGEVEDGLVDYRRFTEQRAVQAKRVEALAKVLDLAETRYVGGVSQYLEVLDAQRALFDAEIEQATTVESQLVSLTRLYKALGGGWDAPDGPPPEELVTAAAPSAAPAPSSFAVLRPAAPASAPPTPPDPGR